METYLMLHRATELTAGRRYLICLKEEGQPPAYKTATGTHTTSNEVYADDGEYHLFDALDGAWLLPDQQDVKHD